jgi:hypothetical protein
MPSFGAFSSEPATATLTIESDPPGADASISTGASCPTPCSLAVPVADTLVSYALRSYLPQTVPVRPLPGESGLFGLFGSSGTATQFDPNPVFAALQPATPSKPPPPKKRKRPTTAAAPPPPTPAAPPPSMGAAAALLRAIGVSFECAIGLGRPFAFRAMMGLRAGVDVLQRDLLLALTAVTVEYFEKRHVGAGQLVRFLASPGAPAITGSGAAA